MLGKVPWVLLSKLEETNESSFRGHSEFLTFQDKQKYLVWFQEPTLKCGFLEKGQRSQAILSLFWGGSGGRRPGSVPKSQPASVFSTLSCSSIPPLAGTASHAWLVPYHQRNTAEHCCLCLYLVQGQPRRRNRHRWCLYAAFWPVCGSGLGPCCCVLWWRVPSHHTALRVSAEHDGFSWELALPSFAPLWPVVELRPRKWLKESCIWFALSLVLTHSEHWGHLRPGVLGSLGCSRVFHANRHFLCVTFNLATQRISSRLLKNKYICAKSRSLHMYMYNFT